MIEVCFMDEPSLESRLICLGLYGWPLYFTSTSSLPVSLDDEFAFFEGLSRPPNSKKMSEVGGRPRGLRKYLI